MKYLSWLLKAAIFFTLFAFALNNQRDVTLYFFFGTEWHAPMVLVVLTVFSAGVAIGVLGMVPRWWKDRRAVARLRPKTTTAGPKTTPTPSADLPTGNGTGTPPYGI